MPFDRGFQDIYQFGIKKTAEELGIVAERVDEQHFTETILERVYRQIENADFIIAEMTGRNPNVFYEVGYAHAKDKMCALITQNVDDIPFDLKHHSHVVYDGSISDLESKLAPKLEWLVKEAERKRSSTITAKISSGVPILEKNDFQHEGNFHLTINLQNNSDRRSPEIEAIYLTTSKSWKASVENKPCPTNTIEDDKIKHQISPPIRRLAPGAFMKIEVNLRKRFWSKFTGEEPKNEYVAKGFMVVDVGTSEGTITFQEDLEVLFDELPF